MERASAHAIVAALQKVTLEKIVVQSTYGAQPGAHCADLGVLYELEQAVQALATPCCIVRAAYYMSNWLPLVATAHTTGLLPSLVPAHQRVPMVAPQDAGQLGAHLLAAPVTETGLYAIEGPSPYSPADVAACLSATHNQPVTVETIPKPEWENYYLANGFSHMAATSYATMTAIFTHQTYERPQHPHKGATDLATYFAQALRTNTYRRSGAHISRPLNTPVAALRPWPCPLRPASDQARMVWPTPMPEPFPSPAWRQWPAAAGGQGNNPVPPSSPCC
ncbi:Rossmann-fold NAD(P)-binding domain-containing protein [Acetobacter lambici]|uniref:NmrA-like domain-containing protein n=1 Tax=Acetobacter lambici TaxID=1332824 RepID=A0ABT1F525_9PROT|nr:hypothetical protein [Acetobacter lambici]MCP1244030.1 hypothetical protein [Acetobacter lambici]MCP1260071.1 hypothetical protein [Acetobacter lambici]